MKGIRLTDIHGYNEGDFTNYVNNNMAAINSKIAANPGFTEDEIKEEMYLNNLIRMKVGDDAYDRDVRGSNFAYKKDYYNRLFADPKVSSMSGDTDDVSEEIDMQFNDQPMVDQSGITDYQRMWDAGEAQPESMYEYFKMNDINRKDDDIDNFTPIVLNTPENTVPGTNGQLYKRNAIQAGPKELKEQRELDRIFSLLYDPKYQRVDDSLSTSSDTYNAVQEYSNEIRRKFDEDGDLTFEFFKRFEEDMKRSSHYYNAYHDTPMMPITPNKMKDIMAKYYAIGRIQGEDTANQFVNNEFQNIVADQQGLFARLRSGVGGAIANADGFLISGMGYVKNLIPALAKSLMNGEYYNRQTGEDVKFEIDDLSWVKEFMNYWRDDPTVRYGNNLMRTGVFDPELQQRLLEKGVGRNDLLKHTDQGLYSLESTPFELLQQIGFMAGAGILGGLTGEVLSSVLGATTSAAASSMLANGSTLAARITQVLGDALVVGGSSVLPSIAEAGQIAQDEYDKIISSNLSDIDRAVRAEFEKAVENGDFDAYFYSKYPLMAPDPERHLSEQEEQEMIARYNENRNKAANEYMEMLKNDFLSDPEYMKTIQDQALRQSASSMFVNAMVLIATESFMSKLMGPALRDSKESISKNIGMESKFNVYRNADDAIRVADKEGFGRFYERYMKPGARMIYEPFSQGAQEYFQEIDQAGREDLVGDYMSKWIENRNNPDVLNDFADYYEQHGATVSEMMKRHLFSEDARYAFALAFASSVLGQPSLSSGLMQLSQAKNAGVKQSGLEILNSFLRSPVLEVLNETAHNNERKSQEIKDINLWLERHDEVAKMKDIASIMKWSDDQITNAGLNNEVGYRDAMMGEKLSTLIMMDRIGGSSKELSFRKRLSILSKLQYNSPEAQELIDETILQNNMNNVTESERKKLFDNIVSRAQEMVELQDDVHNARKVISAQFGDMLSEESIDALVAESLMQKNLNKRAAQITTSIADAFDRSSNVTTKASRSSATKEQNAVARIGSISEAKRQLGLLQESLANLKDHKADIVRNSGEFGYKHRVDLIKDSIKTLKEDIKNFNSDSESNVITAEMIPALDATARAALLNDNNRRKYSERQIEEIDRFKSADGITKDILDSINDAAAISTKAQTLTKRFAEYYDDARSLYAYDTEIRRKILKQYAERALSGAIQSKSYDDFKKEMDKFLTDPSNLYLSEAHVVEDVLKNNQFYDQYIKETAHRADALDIMGGSPAYKSLKDSQQRGLAQAYFAALADNDTSFDNVYKHLNDPKLMSTVGLAAKDINNQFASNITEILNQIDNYNETMERLEEQQKALRGNPESKSSDNPVPAKDESNGQKQEGLSKDIYNKYRDKVDSIVGKLSSYFSNPGVRVIHISKEDFFTILRLFGDDFGSELLIDDFKISFNESDLLDTFEKAQSAIDNKNYTDPESVDDIKYKNTVQFKNAINKILGATNVGRQIAGIKTTKQFLKNALVDLNKSWSTVLNPPSKKSQDVGKLGNFDILTANELNTQAEKDFYSKNDFQKNFETLAREHKTKDTRIVFVYDEKLGQDILNETGETSFDSDYLPLIACAITNKSTEGATLIDGTYVLPLGLTQYSRDIPMLEEINSLNVLRQIVIDQKQSGIVKNSDGTTYICDGIKLTFSQPVSFGNQNYILRDYLISKHNEDKEAALDDFKNGIVECHLEYKEQDNRVYGWYFYNGVKYKFDYPKPDDSWNDGRQSHPINVYVESEHPDQPYFLFSRRFSDEELDDQGTTIYSLLSDDSDLRSIGAIERFDINNIVNAVEFIRDEIRRGFHDIKRSKDSAIRISNKITKHIDINNINLARKYNEAFGKVYFQFDMDGDNLNAYIINDFYDEGDPNHKITAATIDTTKNITNKDFYIFAKQAIRGLMFDDDANIRLNPTNGEPLVKFQVKDAKARGDDPDARKYQEAIFKAGSYYFSKLHDSIKVTGASINETIQHKASDTGDKVQDSINNLEYYKKRNNRNTLEGSISVSQFVNSSEGAFENLSFPNKVATSLRQSMRKLVKVYLENGKDYDSVIKWMTDNKIATWPGIGGAGNAELSFFIKQQISKIADFLESRDETVVDGDLLFSEQIVGENGKTVKLNSTPDIVTVDKRGKYHIYDVRTIKFKSGVFAKDFDGFNNPHILISGAQITEQAMQKWSEKLSLDKAIMERALGAGKVDTIGVIPIVLDYELPGGSTLSAKTFDIIGENVHNIDINIDGKESKLHVNISEETNAKTRSNTFAINDAIYIAPISDLYTISSDMWDENKEATKEDEAPTTPTKEHYIDGIPTQAPIVTPVTRREGLIKAGKFKPTSKKTDTLKEKKNINDC